MTEPITHVQAEYVCTWVIFVIKLKRSLDRSIQMKIKFQQRELCAVDRQDFHWGDSQTSSTILFDLEDGSEIINIEVSRNVNVEDYLCHIVITNKKYDIRIASNARGGTARVAIARAFKVAEIEISGPTLAELNSEPTYQYKVTPVMEAVAQELGVKRYKIFSAGSEPLR